MFLAVQNNIRDAYAMRPVLKLISKTFVAVERKEKLEVIFTIFAIRILRMLCLTEGFS